MKHSRKRLLKQIYFSNSAALSVFISGMWLGWMSPAVKTFTEGDSPISISPSQISWIVALMDFGNILSPIPSGYLTDCIGRKTTLLLTAIIYLFTWIITIFAESAELLYVARIGAGIGKGVAFTVVPMYLGEIASVKVRGAISTMFTGLLFGGVLFEYCVGPFVTYDVLNYISTTVPVIFFLSFIMLPESPYYLVMKRRNEKALKCLAWFRHLDKNDVRLQEEMAVIVATVEKDMRERGGFRDLVAIPENRRALTIVLVLSAFQRFGGVSCMLSYTVITLPKTGGFFSPEIYMIIFGLVMVIGNYIGTPLIDVLGRKPLLIISCALCAVCTGVSAAFYWIAGPENNTEKCNWIPYSCFVLYGITYGIGIGVIPTTFVGELFPTKVKSYASAISAIFFGAASFSINKVYLYVKNNLGVEFMFLFFTICSAFSVIFTIFVVFETKGKNFSQIQDELLLRTSGLTTMNQRSSTVQGSLQEQNTY